MFTVYILITSFDLAALRAQVCMLAGKAVPWLPINIALRASQPVSYIFRTVGFRDFGVSYLLW